MECVISMRYDEMRGVVIKVTEFNFEKDRMIKEIVCDVI
jgi:hypothetical protein